MARGWHQHDVTSDQSAWVELPGPKLVGHAAVYDPLRDRIVAVGGGRTWQLTLEGDAEGGATWSELITPGPSPPDLVGRAAIYDPVRDRMLVFGGLSDDAAPVSDVWALQLVGRPVWSRLEIAGAVPPARGFSAAVYDPVHDAMIIFAGDGRGGTGSLNDAWSLSLSGGSAWHELEPAGTPPGARWGHSATYDPVRKCMVIFGGRNGVPLGDLWCLSLGDTIAWRQLPQQPFPPPGGRSAHTMIYDPIGDRMLLYDGAGAGTALDLWALSLAGQPTWTRLHAVNGDPPWRAGHTACYDPRRRRMIVVGGGSYVGVWAGGTDTWALSLTGPLMWTPLIGANSQPIPRVDHSAVLDPVRDRMIIFGGYAGGDFASFEGGAYWFPLAGRGVWGTFPCCSPGPRGRAGHSAIFDSVRDRMIVFGGLVDDGEDEGTSFLANELWAASFSLDAAPGTAPWSRIAAEGSPPSPRLWHRAIYDPDGDRMLVYGGYDGSYHSDLWSLSLSGQPRWTELHPEGPGPGPLAAYSAVFDSRERRLLLFGGADGPAAANVHAETWALSLGSHPRWTLLDDGADPRLARLFHSAIYDERRRRMVIWGGFRADVRRDVNDCWALSLNGKPEWQQLDSRNAPPDPREGHTAIYDPVAERMVIFAGYPLLNDIWALPLDPEKRRIEADAASLAQVGDLLAARVAMAPPTPNPSAGETDVRFSLPTAFTASLAIYDAGGRIVRWLGDGFYAAGEHRLHWDGRDATGHRSPSGLYFVRLMSTEGTLVQKLVLARGPSAR